MIERNMSFYCLLIFSFIYLISNIGYSNNLRKIKKYDICRKKIYLKLKEDAIYLFDPESGKNLNRLPGG